ncbi:hypothetical protein BU15DRAFT_60897 [Melanogaster broomeanus]|nr:hypothetical protein BU15DRAFT_60897 [Melanogaster broomeanus]
MFPTHILLSGEHTTLLSSIDWLQTLIRTAASDQTTPPLTYHAKRLTHYECRWDGVQHECLLVVIGRSPTAATPNTTSDPFADASDDLHAPNTPQLVGNEYYIRVSRSIAVSGFLSRVGVIHRNALDVITVTPDCKIDNLKPMAPPLRWPTSVLPSGDSRTLSAFRKSSAFVVISSRTLYRVIETMFVHPGYWWRLTGWENSSSIKNTETIVALLRTVQRHEEVAAKASFRIPPTQLMPIPEAIPPNPTLYQEIGTSIDPESSRENEGSCTRKRWRCRASLGERRRS